MLDTDTKRRIDTCRDILVGKVPDPKSQVEQITIALIYKFMDDMDLEAEELGGQRRFFTKEFERYRWAKLVAPGVAGQETLNTYSEALTKMVENEGLPSFFRQIFRNAYLPYRDPETLRAFLREIDTFTYDHSERLGDAFEYLLSVLGSQGDAGQFRTPRHIIDFMVEIISPQKHEVILDPACGTAGFLISAYKNILKQNTTGAAPGNGAETGGDAAEQALESPKRYKGDLLTSEDRARLARNIKGYDISPDMVRLSRVNMFLHDFKEPVVEEYDTLTSEDKWTEMADVILANPPFMSPKGGIKPHTRFQVQSKRSEVLFVDYIAEHLTPNGRAAIVVPEGIIFQSQTAYVALRKMLVENHLAAVISLPAGVFNPYSGVKTSILILDRSVAKASQHVAFFKIENDGFALGAQRKAVKGSQLPQVKAELGAWLQAARAGGGEGLESNFGSAVKRSRIAEGNDYNLSVERYTASEKQKSEWALVTLDEICQSIQNGYPVEQIDGPGKHLVTRIQTIADGSVDLQKTKSTNDDVPSDRLMRSGDILFSHINSFDHLAKAALFEDKGISVVHGINLVRLRPDESKVHPKYLLVVLKSVAFVENARRFAQRAVNQASIKVSDIRAMEIPLPPLEVQHEIVAEVEGYQRVIDGARAVLDNYRPHIPVDPEWPIKTLEEVARINPDSLNPEREFSGGQISYFDIASVENHSGRILEPTLVPVSDAPSRARRRIEVNDLLISTVRPNLKAFGIVRSLPRNAVASTGFAVIRAVEGVSDPFFLLHSIRSDSSLAQLTAKMEKGSYPSVNQTDMAALKLPMPPIEFQQAIAIEIEAEQALVNGNRDLIARLDKKIDAAVARVWGGAKVEGAA
ncbi:N-6 DNA methylase [Sinorhizobium meliloti]|nr:N-6 DNA methylase [Sinorhizobium meliloti]MDW9837391.1 N-6 DNA methylase [Sinorhizobium meliloti]MDX0041704.1 N-6 DNA methylase [Sinorhizobium meliloti]MDX0088770.1 N-6 DNA methylase [Sinorhizobium meliloti]